MKTSQALLPRSRLVILLLLPTLPAALAACPGPKAEDGPVILQVGSVPVTAGELQREIDFRLTFTRIAADPGEAGPDALSPADLTARVVNECLIPLAAVKGAYSDRIPGMLAKAEELRDAVLSDLSRFDRLAEEHNPEGLTPGGGGLGFFGRGSGLPYPLPQVAFSMQPGTVSEPFLSLVGCHILFVKGKIEGVTDAHDRVEVSQIFLPYEADEKFLQKTLPELTAAAKVELLDPALRELVQTPAR